MQVYLDNAASTKVLPEVLDAMMPFLREYYGNPQSMHGWGDHAREAMDEARDRVAQLIGGDAEGVIFTSSGTESNNLAIKGLARAQESKGRHIVISAIEHFSIVYSAKTMQKLGFDVTQVPVDRYGMIDPDEVARSLRKDTILVSVMHANGEVGTIQPIHEIAKVVKDAGVVFHTDAVATAGNIPVDVKEMGVDALSLAGNQMYGPRGSGALWIKDGVRIIPFLDGGVQEGGKRAGTEDVPAVVGLGKAAELAASNMMCRMEQQSRLRDILIRELPKRIEHVVLTGHPSNRLPGNTSFCIEFIEGEAMLMFLSEEGVAVSSGSACTSKALKASHVLTAMGIAPEIAQGSLLFTMGLDNTEADIAYALDTLSPIVDRLRQMSPLYSKFLKEQKGGR